MLHSIPQTPSYKSRHLNAGDQRQSVILFVCNACILCLIAQLVSISNITNFGYWKPKEHQWICQTLPCRPWCALSFFYACVCVTSRDMYSTELEALSISEVLLLLASVRLLMYLRRWNAWSLTSSASFTHCWACVCVCVRGRKERVVGWKMKGWSWWHSKFIYILFV